MNRQFRRTLSALVVALLMVPTIAFADTVGIVNNVAITGGSSLYPGDLGAVNVSLSPQDSTDKVPGCNADGATVTVSLSVSSGAITIPASVSFDSGCGTKTVNFTANSVTEATPVTITITDVTGGRTHQGNQPTYSGIGSSATITVLPPATPPNTAPTLVLANANIGVEGNVLGGAIVAFGPFYADDEEQGQILATCDFASGALFPLGETTVTCSASDNGGLTATASFVVTVSDTTNPTVNVSNLTATATSNAGASVAFTATASDIVWGDVSSTVTCKVGNTVITSPHVFPAGVTTVSCSAVDGSENTGNGSFTVTVNYNVSTTLSLPSAKAFKTGSTIPVRFSIASTGTPITNAVANISYRLKASTGDWIEGDAVQGGNADFGSAFRYDPTSDQYIFNLGTGKTWTLGLYEVKAVLNDGSVLIGEFNLGK